MSLERVLKRDEETGPNVETAADRRRFFLICAALAGEQTSETAAPIAPAMRVQKHVGLRPAGRGRARESRPAARTARAVAVVQASPEPPAGSRQLTDPEGLAICVAQLNLVELVLGHSDVFDDPSNWRVAVHEAGHALVALVCAIDFTDAVIYAAGEQRGLAGQVRVTECDVGLEPFPLGSRIAWDLGGAVAEEIVFGNVDSSGLETDLRDALARVHILDPNAVAEADHGLGWARRQVQRVRTSLRCRRPALLALARVLLRARRLDRQECARVVRNAGSRVRMRPLFSPVVRADEYNACTQIRDELARRNRDARRAQIARIARRVANEVVS